MSCCGGNCGCGSACSCNGCSRNADIPENSTTTTQTLIVGVAPAKSSYEGSEMSFGSETGGCSCGPSCSCDPCNCK